MPKRADHAAPLVEPRRFQPQPLGHAHDYHQLLFGVDGAIELEIDGHAYRVDAEHGLVVPGGEHHVCVGLTENLQLVADFPASSVALPARLMARPRTFALDGPLAAQVRTLVAIPKPARAPRRSTTGSARPSSAGNLATSLGQDLTRHDAARFPVLAIDACLRASLAEPPRADQLASRFGWGARHFHTLFCEAFGDTPHGYQTRLRLGSGRAVADGRHDAAGRHRLRRRLSRPDHLYRAFARRFGLPPGSLA